MHQHLADLWLSPWVCGVCWQSAHVAITAASHIAPWNDPA